MTERQRWKMAGVAMQSRSHFNEGDGELLASRMVFVHPGVEEG